jgi:hypothetical protein
MLGDGVMGFKGEDREITFEDFPGGLWKTWSSFEGSSSSRSLSGRESRLRQVDLELSD